MPAPQPTGNSRPINSIADLFARQAEDAVNPCLPMTIAAATRSASMTAAQQSMQITLLAQCQARGGRMRVITDFERLKGTSVGSGQCPGVVQTHGGPPLVATWIEGPKIRDNPAIPYGAAIATFVNGRYENKEHGNHVAIYIRQDPVLGLYVFDQWLWLDGTRKKADYRWMKCEGDRSNNGNGMSLVLTPL